MTVLPEPAAGRLAWLDEDLRRDGVLQRRFDVMRDGRRIPGLLWTPDAPDAPDAPDTPDAPDAPDEPDEPAGDHRCLPLVMLGHGGSGSKRQDHVVAMARRLVRQGMAAAAIDGPVHGDRRPPAPAPPALVLAEFAQLWANDGDVMTDEMVADVSATLDALGELPEVAGGPVGWWGVSMGTIVGLPAVAADPRFGACVLGLMGLTGPTRGRIARDAARVRCPTLFIVQWDDAMFPRDAAIGLWEALGSPEKSLLAHPGDHGDLPLDAFEASARFLSTHLVGPTRRRADRRGPAGP